MWHGKNEVHLAVEFAEKNTLDALKRSWGMGIRLKCGEMYEKSIYAAHIGKMVVIFSTYPNFNISL